MGIFSCIGTSVYIQHIRMPRPPSFFLSLHQRKLGRLWYEATHTCSLPKSHTGFTEYFVNFQSVTVFKGKSSYATKTTVDFCEWKCGEFLPLHFHVLSSQNNNRTLIFVHLE